MTEALEEDEEGTQLRSIVEIIKERSNYLRGTVKETLESDAPQFSEEEYHVLKFHGIYQQDDRDERSRARKEGRDKEWIMMIRTKFPGGAISADQYLAMDDIADRWGDGTLRVTTRQNFQFHHVPKGNLKRLMQAINEAMCTTLGACGDLERNLMACPAPDHRGFVSEVQHYAQLLSDHSLPKTHAYYEIWLDHEKVFSNEVEEEPLYGKVYLPRKFKSGLAIEGDNCIDVYSQDIGMVAHVDDGHLAGFTVLVGGGLGKLHTDPNTRPRVGDPICFVEPDRLLDTFLNILRIQRDHGNRISRRQARMKYLVASVGVERFRAELQRRCGFPLAPARSLHWENTGDHLGWHEQHDGRWYLGVWVENGRIQDADGLQTKRAVRKLVERYRPGVRLTPQQSVLFTDIEDGQRADVEQLLREYGVPFVGDLSPTLRYSMACPAIPTCGLALAEAERALPPVIRRIEEILAEEDLLDERISVRMTGCPNGCARPYLGDIGFVGRTVGRYQVYVGGDFEGTRLNRMIADMVPVDQIADRLRPLFQLWKQERSAGEGFGDFCFRVGTERLREIAFPEKQFAWFKK